LDAALVERAVQAGAEFLPGTKATVGDVQSHARTITLDTPGYEFPVTASIALVADGLEGKALREIPSFATEVRPAARVGGGTILDCADQAFRPGVIYMITGAAGYVGLVRLEDGRLNIATALDVRSIRASNGMSHAVSRTLDEAHAPRLAGIHRAKWRGTPPLTQTRLRVAGRHLFVIGDAAGYVEPFTGEGMAWALTSGVAVAPLAAAATRGWDDQLAEQWQSRHRTTLAARKRMCRLVTCGLRSRALTRVALHVLASAPSLATPVIRAINRPPALAY
jgi:flavin-dependent dehydrogenase